MQERGEMGEKGKVRGEWGGGKGKEGGKDGKATSQIA